jgi:hypothetical protein
MEDYLQSICLLKILDTGKLESKIQIDGQQILEEIKKSKKK